MTYRLCRLVLVFLNLILRRLQSTKQLVGLAVKMNGTLYCAKRYRDFLVNSRECFFHSIQSNRYSICKFFLLLWFRFVLIQIPHYLCLHDECDWMHFYQHVRRIPHYVALFHGFCNQHMFGCNGRGVVLVVDNKIRLVSPKRLEVLTQYYWISTTRSQFQHNYILVGNRIRKFDCGRILCVAKSCRFTSQ